MSHTVVQAEIVKPSVARVEDVLAAHHFYAAGLHPVAAQDTLFPGQIRESLYEQSLQGKAISPADITEAEAELTAWHESLHAQDSDTIALREKIDTHGAIRWLGRHAARKGDLPVAQAVREWLIGTEDPHNLKTAQRIGELLSDTLVVAPQLQAV